MTLAMTLPMAVSANYYERQTRGVCRVRTDAEIENPPLAK